MSPRTPENRNNTLCVFNASREAFLTLGLTAADTHFARLRGLLGKVRLRPDEGMWLIPCQGVHTWGLLFPIDVVYLDAQNRVVHVIEHLGPFRIAPLKRRCHSVLELPVRTIYSSNTQVGDELVICTLPEWQAYWSAAEAEQRNQKKASARP